MRAAHRTIFDKAFTILTGLTVVLLIAVLLVILGPMFRKGLSAVVFKGTVEFRKMQLAEFSHGNATEVRRESEEVETARRKVYAMIDEFKSGIDSEELTDKAKDIYREFGQELRRKDLPRDEYTNLRSLAREIRDKLIEAFSIIQ